MRLWKRAPTSASAASPCASVSDFDERERMQDRINALEAEQRLHQHLFANLSGFGDSMVTLRESFSELSGLLVGNQRISKHTASESQQSQEALNAMVEALRALNQRIG